MIIVETHTYNPQLATSKSQLKHGILFANEKYNFKFIHL